MLPMLLGFTCGGIPRANAQQPGLWDAHAHLSYYGEQALDRLVGSGVVAVRDCGGDAAQLKQWRDEIARGQRKGPRIFFSGPILDGPKPEARFRLIVQTPEDARQAVDSLTTLGVDFIKTHNAVPRDAYFAVLKEARRRGLRVASHLPRGVPAWEAADSGVGSIEHAAESLLASPIYAGYASNPNEAAAWWRSPAGDAAIARLARSGVAVTPTLAAFEALAEMSRGTPAYETRRAGLEVLIELTGRLHRAGVTILAGTDFSAPNIPLVPGVSLLREMELLQRAGLTTAEATAAAGTNISRWLERPR
jgi:imidazolonepropionase-like amidohydrolase